jgi:hypothetical protein
LTDIIARAGIDTGAIHKTNIHNRTALCAVTYGYIVPEIITHASVAFTDVIFIARILADPGYSKVVFHHAAFCTTAHLGIRPIIQIHIGITSRVCPRIGVLAGT